MIFVTLTYPHEYPVIPTSASDTSQRYASASIGSTGHSLPSGGWAYSRGGRGTSICSRSWGRLFGPLVELRRFISSSWYEVTGKVSEGHLRAGTRVKP